MSEANRQTSWVRKAYLEWEAGQPIRYEIVDGHRRTDAACRARCISTRPTSWPGLMLGVAV
jgi:hypothetical protein